MDLSDLARAVAAGDRPHYEKDWEALRQASLVKRSTSGVDRRAFYRAILSAQSLASKSGKHAALLVERGRARIFVPVELG